MTNLLTFKVPTKDQLWGLGWADPAGGLLSEDEMHLAYFEVMLGVKLTTSNGSSFNVPSYIVNSRNQWLRWGH